MKKFMCVLITLAIAFGAMSVTAFAQDEISITAYCPWGLCGGQSKVFTVPTNTTAGELREMIATGFSMDSANSDYIIYCSDLTSANRKFPDADKTLAEYGVADGATIYFETLGTWNATADSPITLFGLTIYGGKIANDPISNDKYSSSIDIIYNYYYKSITIKSNAQIYITGTADSQANIIVNPTRKISNLTLTDTSFNTIDGNAIHINPSSTLNLTIHGTNTIIGSSSKDPAITLANSSSRLRIKSASTGSLTVTSADDNVPAIGTRDTNAQIYGIEIQGGNITANGGKNAPAIRTNYIQVSGGNLTANGGENSENAIQVYNTGKVSSITEGLFQTTPAGTVTVNSKISADEVKNAGKLVFNSYDSLPDGEAYNHTLSGTVLLGDTEYVWKESQNCWVEKCNHIESGILYTGEGEHIATCESAGLGHTECTLCGEIMNSAVTVSPTGHDLALIDAGDDYHMTICQNGCGLVITDSHIYVDSKCIVCGKIEVVADSDEEVVNEDEEVVIDTPVESDVEETDSTTDIEESPATGICFGMSAIALFAAVAVITKK